MQAERVREAEALRVAEEEKQRPVAKRRSPKPPDPARQRRKLEREAEAAEGAVESAEQAVATIEADLADSSLYDGTMEKTRRAEELGRLLEEAKGILEDAMAKWSEAVEALEEFDESAQ